MEVDLSGGVKLTEGGVRTWERCKFANERSAEELQKAAAPVTYTMGLGQKPEGEEGTKPRGLKRFLGRILHLLGALDAARGMSGMSERSRETILAGGGAGAGSPWTAPQAKGVRAAGAAVWFFDPHWSCASAKRCALRPPEAERGCTGGRCARRNSLRSQSRSSVHPPPDLQVLTCEEPPTPRGDKGLRKGAGDDRSVRGRGAHRARTGGAE